MTAGNLSVWADTYGPYEANPPLREERRVDVAVVGGGFNGLSTAWHLRRSGESIQVALLEGDDIGAGSSGRNAGVAMTQFGFHVAFVKWFYGRQRALEAFQYTSRALDYTRQLVSEHSMQSDVEDNRGVLRVAMARRWVKELEGTRAFYEDLGVGDELEWLDADALAEEISSPLLAGAAALFERNLMLLNPCKHVREWKRLALEAGVSVYERSPVTEISYAGPKIRLGTPQGAIIADKVVLATNAYTHRLPGCLVPRGDQWPIYAYQFATEPLSGQQWAQVGWNRRCLIENNLQMFHWFRPTADGRIIFGGRKLPAADSAMTRAYDPEIFHRLERDFRAFFPALQDVRVTHKWGGVISGTADLVPHIGFVDDRRQVVLITGCWGHFVAMAHLNGRLVSDLLREIDSELTNFWIVNRKTRGWPPGPARAAGVGAIIAAFRGIDEWMLHRACRDSGAAEAATAFKALRT